MDVQPDIVTILADAAENVVEIDIARAEEARQRAEKYLEEGPPRDTDAYLRMEAALRRSNLRLDAVRRYRKTPRTSVAPSLQDENT
jgi:F-type H+-transporting ATPase subunit epsilon